jgi:hypothetical protein
VLIGEGGAPTDPRTWLNETPLHLAAERFGPESKNAFSADPFYGTAWRWHMLGEIKT